MTWYVKSYIHTPLRRDVLWYVESCISLTEKYTFTYRRALNLSRIISRLFLCFYYQHRVSLADLLSFGFISHEQKIFLLMHANGYRMNIVNMQAT